MSTPLLDASRPGKVASGAAAGDIVPLDGVSLDLARGETLALVGPSGSGKSTLARLVMRLIEPDAGAHPLRRRSTLPALRGAALRALRPRFQMVFQDPLAAFNPRATVGGVLDDPLRIHRIAPGRSDRPRRIAALLERVGLDPALARARIHEISGGQRQRVAIARAIATRPGADRARRGGLGARCFGRAPDPRAACSTLQPRRRLAYLFISHDLALVAAFADRVAILDARQDRRGRPRAPHWSRRPAIGDRQGAGRGDPEARTARILVMNARDRSREKAEPGTGCRLPQPRRPLPADARGADRRDSAPRRPKAS